MATFCHLVLSGRQVLAEGLRERVEAAHALTYLLVDSAIAGVAAIKQPAPCYRRSVFTKAEVGADDEEFVFELGWLILDGAYRRRGFSEILIRAALGHASGNVFATAAADNIAVHRINQKVGLKPVGRPYASTSGHNLRLYLRTA